MARLGMRVASLGVVVGLVALVIPALPVGMNTDNSGRLTLPPAKADEGLSRGLAQHAYGRLPMSFEANRGQTDPRVEYLARGSGYTLFLTAQDAVIVLSPSQDAGDVRGELAGPRGAMSRPRRAPTVVRMRLIGASTGPQVSGRGALPGKVNYFIGNDPSKWRTNIPTYAQVHYREVYQGVDLVYYGSRGALEYDFVVAAGANPEIIRLSYEGVQRLEVDARGDLVLHTAGGKIYQRKPLIYQETAGVREMIAGGYVLRGMGQVGVQIGAYDARYPLVIDPVLSYSTFLGGSADESGSAVAVDTRRNAYVTGFTFSTNFPTTAGAFQTTLRGTSNAFVTKLNAAGSALVYSTYLGGSMINGGSGIAVDATGNAYVSGQTSSTNFPTTVGAFQTTLRGTFNAFVTKLNAAGSALVYSTYLGGSMIDGGSGIAVDATGNAYVTGQTSSTNFPTTMGAFQTTYGGGISDAFVTKINPAGMGTADLVYSSYLGGSLTDSGSGIAVDATGNAYVTGRTSSTNFPTTMGAFQTTYGGGISDAFVAKINPMGTALVYSTYLGGSSDEVGNAIAVDTSGNAYVTGCTNSTNFPTTMGAFQTSFRGASGPSCSGTSAAGDAFVTKINAAGSALVYSTYLGGSDNDSGFGIAVDSAGFAYVTGRTDSTDFPTLNALQPSTAGMSDAFVAKINPMGTALVYSTYLGGSLFDAGFSIAVDVSKNVYVTGQTNSGNFPTRNPLQLNLAGQGDAFVTRLAPFQKVALYNPATATFYARRTNTSGTADASVVYGPANLGWIPLIGDWIGIGAQGIGLYDPTTATFYLRNVNNTTGTADIVFTYGPANMGWVPLIGDWTGSGVQTVGLYNPATATFYLRNSNSTGTADIVFTYGPANAGWFPLVGDWDGDGMATVGLYDPTTARFFLRNSNSTGQADIIFTYGPANAGWFPLVGDWTGLGMQTVGLYNPATATYFLRNSNSAGVANIVVNFGPGGPPTPPWLPGNVNWDGL